MHELVKRCPQLQIVLVRSRGIWGSLFSAARTGQPPALTGVVLTAVAWLVASLVFFLPRRRVQLHLEVLPRELLPLESRQAFNRFLEGWYNADGPQAPTFVRFHHFLGPREATFQPAQSLRIDPASLRPRTIAQVNEIVASFLKRELDPDSDTTTKLEDLGLDSLDRMELALRIEQQFGFRSNAVVDTLGGLWALADGRLAADASSSEPLRPPRGWFESRSSGNAGRDWLLDETIAAAFVRRMTAATDRPAVADAMSGLLSRHRLLLAASLMARRFETIPEPHVGLMLPATAAADIAFFALQLAGKVPVMLNWTTGPAHLAHGIKVTGVRRVVSSRKLVDRLGIAIEGADYLFLEDVRGTIGKLEAIRLAAAARLAPDRMLRRLPEQDPDRPAVFLFTSGSEAAPKTVPLSHRNLLTNIRDSLGVLQPHAQDSLLGFLPPFHSFGLTGNVLLPQLAGIRSVRHADPTDARGLVRLIEAYRPTMLFTTPTFLGFILEACQGNELASLRKIITGAEACPESVSELCRRRAPEAVILEGYGITECSPVVAANRLDDIRPGSIGRPVPHVEVRVIDEATGREAPVGETGMLLVRGASVFQGYLGDAGPGPFVEFQGQRWYRTGDLVAADADGHLRFRGRLKRFLKTGGEMVSLPALESPFQTRFPPDEHGPRVAVEGIETDEGRHIVLFTTFELSLRDAAEILISSGFRGVMRLDEVRRLEKIPVLGTGKTDYTTLRRLISAASNPEAPA